MLILHPFVGWTAVRQHTAGRNHAARSRQRTALSPGTETSDGASEPCTGRRTPFPENRYVTPVAGPVTVIAVGPLYSKVTCLRGTLPIILAGADSGPRTESIEAR